MFPELPGAKDFLAFLEKSLEGPLFAVTVCTFQAHQPAELPRRRRRVPVALTRGCGALGAISSLMRK